jgi:quercetin dioxygenase-like cupin family protein
MSLDGHTVRRIVTGHDDSGRAIVLEDEQHDGTFLTDDPSRTDATFFHLWATHESPVSLTDEALAVQRQGDRTTTVGSGHGSVLRIGVLAPGSRSPMHRTESLDYAIVLDGECDMELDGGEVVTVRRRDIVIQRGTNHVWHNRSEAPCTFAWILLDATPAVVGGKRLGSNFGPPREDRSA